MFYYKQLAQSVPASDTLREGLELAALKIHSILKNIAVLINQHYPKRLQPDKIWECRKFKIIQINCIYITYKKLVRSSQRTQPLQYKDLPDNVLQKKKVAVYFENNRRRYVDKTRSPSTSKQVLQTENHWAFKGWMGPPVKTFNVQAQES